MSVRTKLNVACIQGAIIIAALVAWSCQSRAAFFLIAAVLNALSAYAGDIRAGSRRLWSCPSPSASAVHGAGRAGAVTGLLGQITSVLSHFGKSRCQKELMREALVELVAL